MNAKDLLDTLTAKITLAESVDEIRTIALLVLENFYDIDRTDILNRQSLDYELSPALLEIINRINAQEPVQYVLNEAYFLERKFFVDKNVLIPRPETEQLVRLVKAEFNNNENVRLLDVGTGSGCIAVSLAKELPLAEVFAVDISEQALLVAKRNSEALNATVFFDQLDVLTEQLPYTNLNAIVSNPPYVMLSEKEQIHENVLGYEPHLALFVPDTDALIFYKAIAQHAVRCLTPAGKIFVEINEKLSKEVCEVFQSAGFKNTEIVKDIFGKYRIVTAKR